MLQRYRVFGIMQNGLSYYSADKPYYQFFFKWIKLRRHRRYNEKRMCKKCTSFIIIYNIIRLQMDSHLDRVVQLGEEC